MIIEWVPWYALPATAILGLVLPRAARFLAGFVRAVHR